MCWTGSVATQIFAIRKTKKTSASSSHLNWTRSFGIDLVLFERPPPTCRFNAFACGWKSSPNGRRGGLRGGIGFGTLKIVIRIKSRIVFRWIWVTEPPLIWSDGLTGSIRSRTPTSGSSSTTRLLIQPSRRMRRTYAVIRIWARGDGLICSCRCIAT